MATGGQRVDVSKTVVGPEGVRHFVTGQFMCNGPGRDGSCGVKQQITNLTSVFREVGIVSIANCCADCRVANIFQRNS